MQVIAGEKEKIYYSGVGLKKSAGTLPSAASPCGAVARPASRPSGLRASVLPGRRAGQALEEVVADGLELVAQEAKVNQGYAEVEPRGGLVVLARIAPAGRPGQLRLRDHREAEDRHAAGLACMGRSIAESEFDRPFFFEQGRYIQTMISVAVVVREGRAVLAEPGLVELAHRPRLAGDDALDEGAVAGLRVPLEAALERPEGLVDEDLLLVEAPHQVGDLLGREVGGADVDVLAGGGGRLRSGAADGADALLVGGQVVPGVRYKIARSVFCKIKFHGN